MSGKKLTDNGIIKALEDEIHLAEYVDSDYCSNVKLEIIKSALDLITRQQAEIENLKERCIEIQRCDKELIETLHKIHEKEVQTAKSESVKEFAERLEKKAVYSGLVNADIVYKVEIDNIFKNWRNNSDE